MITLDNVSYSYGTQPVLQEVSCSIPSGGVTSLIGANGAGKSTMLSLLARLLSPSAGKITVGGYDVQHTKDAELAKVLAILRQQNQVTTRLRVDDLVAFGRFPHSRGRLNDKDRERITEALALLDLLPLRHRYLDELSGGQRQRAFIAMVICQDTEVILLDEPLNGLDLKHSRDIMTRLRAAADDLGKTIVLVLHDINIAARYSDLLLALGEGKLLYSGAPSEVLTAEKIHEIYDLEVQVIEVDNKPLVLHF